jgi:hypothetical protein
MAQSIKTQKRPDLSALQVMDSTLPEEPIKTHTRGALSGWPMIIAWIGMLIFALHACTHMVAAGDTWVAMACGRHFVNHGVNTVEPFSANSHKPGPTPEEIKTWPDWAQWITNKVGLETVRKWHPTGWVNQNWLTHVIFYKLVPKSSYSDGLHFTSNALVYWKFAIYILTVICVYYTGVHLGVNPALSAVFSCFAMFIARSFLDVRPQGFSNLLVAVFLLILALTTYKNMLYIWLIVPLTVFWCNVHGGYIYVFIMLAAFFMLHLQALPKRWTVSVYSIIQWFVLYGLTYRFLSNESLEAAVPSWIFYLPLFLLVGASIIITASKSVRNGTIYTCHLLGWLIIFLILLPKFFPTIARESGPQDTNEIQGYIARYQFYFVSGFLSLLGLGAILTFLRKKLVSIKPVALLHILAAGIVTFLAVIVFNPFHLTNLTHTFVISVSKDAERWRDVHEWHPAFAWDNPVGTSFPLLEMFILGAGLFILWLFLPMLRPKYLKASKNELEMRERRYATLSKIFSYAAAVLAFWVIFVGFSLLNLDVGSFIVCAAFAILILLSVRVSIYYIYLLVPLTLFAVLAGNPHTGCSGRYIYPFVTIPAYVIVHIVTSLLSKSLRYKRNDIIHIVAASVGTLLLMTILLNPFHFKAHPQNIIAYLKEFIQLRRVWHPDYESNLELTYANLFIGLYIVNIACAVIWFAIPLVEKTLKHISAGASEETPTQMYQPPSIDLAQITIAALTIYMAYRSRRFIPIAAITTCPIIAMFIDQIVRAISATLNFRRHNRLSVSPMSPGLQLTLSCVGVVAVLFFGIWWGLKFKRVYLDPWPPDPDLTSVFMRLTASDAKPFSACKFIKDNKLKGKMFNYWTEGGFIAWGQEPDPNTGQTPLKLFMDGRAQAAYNVPTFNLWTSLMTGGPSAQIAGERARVMGQEIKLTADDYKNIGEWIDQQLKKYNVWVVLMPAGQFDTPFVRGLDYSPIWRIVLINNKDKLFVDVTTPQGQELYDGIFTGKTLFPDDFCKSITIAHNLFLFGKGTEEKQQGLEFTIKAFNSNPSPTPMLEAVFVAARFPELIPRIDDFCRNVVDDFTKNRDLYTKQNGYRLRVEAVRLACMRLERMAQTEKNTERLEFYAAARRRCEEERNRLSDEQRW